MEMYKIQEGDEHGNHLRYKIWVNSNCDTILTECQEGLLAHKSLQAQLHLAEVKLVFQDKKTIMLVEAQIL